MIRQAKQEDTQSLGTLLKQLGYTPDIAQLEQTLIQNNGTNFSDIYIYEHSEPIVGRHRN